MNIIISGSGGFIANDFIELYGDKFDQCILLVRTLNKKYLNKPQVKQVLWSLGEEINIDVPSNTVFLHTAFDSSNYENNISGIKSIVRFVNKNNIDKLIYLSSFSVYDFKTQDQLNENSNYSNLNDPYSYCKREIEIYLKNQKALIAKTPTIVLQPSIVIGAFGNWTLHAIKSIQAKKIIIPEGLCNFVYVKDVCNAIYLSCKSEIKGYRNYLVSHNDAIHWKCFYEEHTRLLESSVSNKIIIDNSVKNRSFHRTGVINLLYRIAYSKYFVHIILKIFPLLRKLKPIGSKSKDPLGQAILDGKELDVFEPVGINRLVHQISFVVDVDKIKNDIGFFTKFGFVEAVKDINKKLSNDN